MDKYEWLRIIVLTSLFWVPAGAIDDSGLSWLMQELFWDDLPDDQENDR